MLQLFSFIYLFSNRCPVVLTIFSYNVYCGHFAFNYCCNILLGCCRISTLCILTSVVIYNLDAVFFDLDPPRTDTQKLARRDETFEKMIKFLPGDYDTCH